MEQTNSYAVPKTVTEMHDMALRRSSKIQKNVLAHANAQRAIQIMKDESNNQQNQKMLKESSYPQQTGERHSTASRAAIQMSSQPKWE